MNWSEYEYDFTQKAQIEGYDKDNTLKLLAYAKNLFTKSLPIIFDIEHLALLVGYKSTYINRVHRNAKHFYRHFEVRKKSGGVRDIYAPLPSLKDIQSWVLNNILYKCQISIYAKAYVRKKSIKDAARFHRGQRYVVAIDIKDFFNFISRLAIKNAFLEIGYENELSEILSSICCLDGHLPQGAPTSPALSNIIFRSVDNAISGYCHEYKVKYTRYADDLIFSGDFNVRELINIVDAILTKNGFKVNDLKTKVMNRWQRQIVTGVIVNEKSLMQVPIEVRKKLRQEMFYINKFGLESHISHTKNNRARYVAHLLGVANQILFINPNDYKVAEFVVKLKEIVIE